MYGVDSRSRWCSLFSSHHRKDLYAKPLLRESSKTRSISTVALISLVYFEKIVGAHTVNATHRLIDWRIFTRTQRCHKYMVLLSSSPVGKNFDFTRLTTQIVLLVRGIAKPTFFDRFPLRLCERKRMASQGGGYSRLQLAQVEVRQASFPVLPDGTGSLLYNWYWSFLIRSALICWMTWVLTD